MFTLRMPWPTHWRHEQGCTLGWGYPPIPVHGTNPMCPEGDAVCKSKNAAV